MKTKKPDSFARAVEKAKHRPDGHPIGYVLPSDCAKLLRSHHRKIERLVRRMINEKKAEIRCIDDGLCDRDLNRPAEMNIIQREMQVCNDVLAALRRLVN